jgi:hypothetical protein
MIPSPPFALTVPARAFPPVPTPLGSGSFFYLISRLKPVFNIRHKDGKRQRFLEIAA